MKHKSFNEKRINLTREKKLEKLHYRLVIILLIIFLLHNIFFDATTIGGHDYRYVLYIFLLPTLIGVIALGFYRRNFLISEYVLAKGFFLKIFLIGFYLFQGIFLSYISLGLLAHVGWNYLNKRIAKQNSTEAIICNVTRFWNGRSPAIDFTFQNQHESFKAQRRLMGEYEDKNPNDYKIEITAQKGLWDYYVVNGWTPVNNRDTL